MVTAQRPQGHRAIYETSVVLLENVNQRIADLSRRHQEPVSGFMCECGRPGCTSIVDLPLSDYEALRNGKDLFIVAPGHCVEGIDRLVESRERYDVLVQV
jgi:hypothetical protein